VDKPLDDDDDDDDYCCCLNREMVHCITNVEVVVWPKGKSTCRSFGYEVKGHFGVQGHFRVQDYFQVCRHVCMSGVSRRKMFMVSLM
jgi:hypothetical protein